jgi:hypothetical protein
MSLRVASLFSAAVLLSGLAVTTTATPAAAAAPDNDSMSSPTVVGAVPHTANQSTVGATTEPGEPLGCRNIGATVWYRFTTQARGIVEVDAITGQNGGAEFKPVLALYSGPDRDHLSRIGCTTSDGNATNLGGGNLPAGTYWAQVGGQDGASGDLRVVIGTQTSGGGGSRSGAVMDSSSCTATVLNRNDDSSTGLVPLPFTLDFYGRTYSSLYVNNNGNVTFDSSLSTYTPFGLSGTSRAIVAPFFADVDTRNASSDTVKYGYGETLYDGRPAFCANWVDVGYYNARYDKSNSFQLLLVDRSDIAAGAFDIVFNYDRIQWETGDASGGSGGLGGSSARAGFSNGSGTTATSYELPGSAVNGAFLDTNSSTGLANNRQSHPQTGRYVYAVRNGNPSCAGDEDCDGLSDSVERYAKTSLSKPDTDGDGLLDAWEVDPNLAGAGIRLPNGRTVDRDDVFGPYSTGTCETVDDELRPVGQYRCLNKRPDPRRKDVYVEIDWQDCTIGGCPEVIRDEDDTLHHAPNVDGLKSAVDMFARAPLPNPNGRSGVQLNLLVDERTAHKPNCNQATHESNLERPNFGTAHQRDHEAADVLTAKNLAVRYMWSGHSAADHHHAGEEDPCPDPNRFDFARQGYGLAELASYDYSPFGSVRVGGSYMVASLGILWNCPSDIGTTEAMPLMRGVLGPCYRETEANLLIAGAATMVDPGIFPAKIDAGSVDGKSWRWPVSRLMGEREATAGRQLWSRTVSHLLGHAMGLESDDDVNNKPAPAGRKQAGKDHPLLSLAPDSYDTWSGLKFAPGGALGGALKVEQHPNYDELARTSLELSDPDDDGVMEHDDNCPGVWNPDQSNDDNGRFHLGHNTAEFGDACDPDIDGDGLRNALPGEGEAVVSGSLLRGSATSSGGLDPMPYDTDNDGEDNALDPDDDGDGVEDPVDSCRLDANSSQEDSDGDGAGDACDHDADGDGLDNSLEVSAGADPLDAGSQPEYSGYGTTCSNGTDDDGDGGADALDSGCVDADSDGIADTDDHCDSVVDVANLDSDHDGIGNACDQHARITGLDTGAISARSPGTRLTFWATQSGPWELRADAADCTSGTVLAAGGYAAGADRLRPAPEVVAIEAGWLSEGLTVLRLCVTGAGGTATDVTHVIRDTAAPHVSAPVLEPTSDTGSSSADAITSAASLSFSGSAEPGAVVAVRRGEVLLDEVVADATGAWHVADPDSAEEGTHAYTASSSDDAGNVGSATTWVVVDRTAPTAQITAGPAEGDSSASTTTFEFTASEPGTVECRLDGGAWELCTSRHQLEGLAFGEHLLELRATDRAGNVQTTPVARRWSVRFTFTGFFAPVDNAPTLNAVRAGSSVPVKFSLAGDHGLDVLWVGSPTSVQVACDTSAPVSETETSDTPGSSSLAYDATSDQYSYVWKTDGSWSGTCRQFRLELADRSVHVFLVKLR